MGILSNIFKKSNSCYGRFVSPGIFAGSKPPPNKEWEQTENLTTRGGESARLNPSQALADQFPMRNGKAITDPASGYNPNNPFFNRDPGLIIASFITDLLTSALLPIKGIRFGHIPDPTLFNRQMAPWHPGKLEMLTRYLIPVFIAVKCAMRM